MQPNLEKTELEQRELEKRKLAKKTDEKTPDAKWDGEKALQMNMEALWDAARKRRTQKRKLQEKRARERKEAIRRKDGLRLSPNIKQEDRDSESRDILKALSLALETMA
ncbi:hypothetical protein MMC30_009004 [Trapelia coarctata]|nr:hypothetical protein [Trapelia coarctata]